LTFSFGKHSGSFTSEKPNYYLETLDYAKQIHVILQDTAHRRAWLTDGERAILHIIFHAQRMGSCGIGGKDIELQGADPKSQSSVRAAMVANANVVVRRDYCMGKDEVGTQRFKDLVGDLYSRLEVCQANAKGETGAGIELKMSRKRQIRGYEFMDLVTKRREMFLKEFNLRRACGNWPEFARDINALMLLGTNFGEVFQPHDPSALCEVFREMPSGSDYLAVSQITPSVLFSLDMAIRISPLNWSIAIPLVNFSKGITDFADIIGRGTDSASPIPPMWFPTDPEGDHSIWYTVASF
jgi:hypothetical protein